MALPVNRPELPREELIAAKIEELRQEGARQRETYPDPWKALGEILREIVGDDPGVLSAASDECYYGECDDDDAR